MKEVKDNPIHLIGHWKYPDSKFICEKQVLIKQTNLFGNTYFANYIEWQGESREKFFLSHPAAKAFMQANPNITLITHSLFHRFIENTYFGDKILIEIKAREIQKYSFQIVFQYTRDHKLIGEGWQKICFSDQKTGTMQSVPQLFLDLLEPVHLN